MRIGGDGDDVDLAVVGVVPLGPMEPEQLAIRSDREQQAGRVEPRLGHPLGEVGRGHRALLGVAGEGSSVDGEQRVGVVRRTEVTDRHARRGLLRRQGYGGTPPHHPELTGPDEPEPSRERVRRGMVAVGPRGQLAGLGRGQRGQPAAEPLSAGVRRDGQVDRVPVPERESVVLDPGRRVRQPVVLEPQVHRLVDRVVPVGGQAGASYLADDVERVRDGHPATLIVRRRRRPTGCGSSAGSSCRPWSAARSGSRRCGRCR